MADIIKVHDLFNKRCYDSKKSVIVKHLPETASQDGIQNYIEVVTNADLQYLCQTCGIGPTNILVAVLSEEIKDISHIKDKPFEEQKIQFEYLGGVGGILVYDVGDVQLTTLDLYFDNPKRSGGKEGSVSDVTYHELNNATTAAVVIINDEEAIQSILSRPEHKVGQQKLQIEPYFPTFHNLIIEDMKQSRGKKSEKRSVKANEKTIPEEIHTSNLSRAPYSSPSLHAEFREPQVNPTKQLPSMSHVPISQQVIDQHTSPKNQGPIPDPSAKLSSSVSSPQLKLRSLTSTPIPNTYSRELVQSTDKKKLCIFIDDDEEPFSDVYEPASPENRIEEPERKRFSSNLSTNEPKNRVVHGRRKRHGSTKRATHENINLEKNIVEEIPRSNADIVLLIIGRFPMKCKEKNLDVQVVLQEKESVVKINAVNKENMDNAKLIMHELWGDTKRRSLKIHRQDRAAYLARPSVQEFLRHKSRADKISAAFEMNTHTMELVCHAYREDVLEKGLQLVADLFVKQSISLREGQERLLQSREWLDFKAKTGTGFTVIYEVTDEIIIETVCTMKKSKITEIRKMVTDFLRSITPKNKEVIELNGGQAEYFQKYCEKDLEDKMRENSRQVKLYIDKVKRDRPVKLVISVEGNTKYIDEVKTVINGIWHEKLSFQRIAPEEGYVWLIMRKLDGDDGRAFFRHFQQDNKCVIEVVREGEIQPPSIRITHKDKQKPKLTTVQRAPNTFTKHDHSSEDTDDEIKAYYDKHREDERKPEVDNTETIKQMEQYQRFQSDMHNPYLNQADTLRQKSYDEAIAVALTKSYEESQPEMNLRRSNQFMAEEEESDIIQIFNYEMPRWGETQGQSRTAKLIIDDDENDSNEILVGRTRVVLMKGEIANQKADVLVNIVDPSGEFKQSTVAKAFLRSAGKQLEQMYNEKITSQKQHGFMVGMMINSREGTNRNKYIVSTNSVGGLKCTDVIHAKLYKDKPEVIQSVMREIYQECASKGYTSIAIPPLGVGRLYRYSAQKVASFMLQETQNSVMSSQLKEVRFVVYEQDTDTHRKFDSEFNKYLQISPERVPQRGRNLHAMGRTPLTPDKMPRNIMEARPFTQCAYQRHLQSWQTQQRIGSIDQFNHPEVGMTRTPRIDKSYSQEHQGRSRRAPMPRRRDRQGYEEARSMSRDRQSAPSCRLSQDQEQGTRSVEKTKQKTKRQSRFSEQSPSAKLKITVFSGCKQQCERARNDLGKKIKDVFLFEKVLLKREHVSSDAKQKIVKVIEHQKVKSMKNNGTYKLMGYKDSVMAANDQIMKILLEDKPTNSHSARKKKKSSMRRATVEFAEVMMNDEPEVPIYWKNFKPGDILKTALIDLKHLFTKTKYEKVILDANDHAYKTIIRAINETFRADSKNIGIGNDATGINPYTQFHVLKVCRIESPELYGQYAGKRSYIFSHLASRNRGYFSKLEKLKGIETASRTSWIEKDRELGQDVYEEVNECYFFHGTKQENIDKICSDGLDSRLCSPDAMFGQGIYGAESVVKADQYTDDKVGRTSGTKKMFLMRMLLGDIFVCEKPHKFKRAPCTECHMDNCRDDKHRHHFDSVVGGMNKLFREFIVYDRMQCYPEYLISYERK